MTNTDRIFPKEGIQIWRGILVLLLLVGTGCSSEETEPTGDLEAQFSFLPEQPNAGDPVLFDGTDSTPILSPITGYRWEFGTGKTGSGELSEHVYTSPGVYEVTLTVTDDRDNTGVISRKLVVGDANPVTAQIQKDPGDPIVRRGASITFDGSDSVSKEGDIQSYEWDFGDDTPRKHGSSVEHTYDSEGIFAITLTVTDQDGFSDTDSLFIGVGEDVSTFNADFSVNPSEPAPGETVTFDASPSWSIGFQIEEFKWDFGDGTVVVQPTAASLREIQTSSTRNPHIARHRYESGGSSPVTVTLTNEGGETTSTTNLIQVQGLSGGFTIRPVHPEAERETVVFDAGASTTSRGEITNYIWDFGDGTGLVEGPDQEVVEHVYSDAGAYTVHLTVEDNSGSVSLQKTMQVLSTDSWPGYGRTNTNSHRVPYAQGDIVPPSNPPTLLTGWTQETTDHMFDNSLIVVQLEEDDPTKTIIAAGEDTANGGMVYAYRNESEIWTESVDGRISSSPVAGDLLDDGSIEIVVGAAGGLVAVISWDGSDAETEWTYPTRDDVLLSPSLVDVTGDGQLEVVAFDVDGILYILNNDGTLLREFRVVNTSSESSPPIPADLDLNGDIEIIVGTDAGSLHVINKYGKEQALFETGGDEDVIHPSLSDIENEEPLQIVVGVDQGNNARSEGSIYILNSSGEQVWSVEELEGAITAPPTLVELDPEVEGMEIVAGSLILHQQISKSTSVDTGRVYAFSMNEDLEEQLIWEASTPEPVVGSPVVADITGQNGMNVIALDRSGIVHVLDSRGETVWRFHSGQASTDPGGSPVVADLMGDGTLNVIFASSLHNQGSLITVIE